MTLIAAVVLGLALDCFLGFTRRALVAFGVVWLAVLRFQSVVVLDENDEVIYWVLQVAIFALGAGLIWLSARARAWRARTA